MYEVFFTELWFDKAPKKSSKILSFVDCFDIVKPELKEDIQETYDTFSFNHSAIKAEIKENWFKMLIHNFS